MRENLKYIKKFYEKVSQIGKIKQFAEGSSIIFEGDLGLPHLAKHDLNFPGIFLLGESLEQTFERNKIDPRWGETEELQRIEAEWFFVHGGKKLKEEAEKNEYETFQNSDKAEEAIRKMLM